MAFTAQDVKELREKTGCGMMDCKNALTQADGNMEAAIDFLREKGLAAAAKKAGRIAAEGIVYASVANNVGVVVEVNAETDFVAKNAEFGAFVADLAEIIAKENPADVDALLNCTKDGLTVADILRDKILTIGENIKIRRFQRYEGDIVTYVHGGGRIGVMIKFETTNGIGDKDEFIVAGKDVAMQIAALNPAYFDEASVPAEVIEKEKEFMIAQMKEDPKMANKPDAVLEKIVSGKIGKYYKENCLMDQAFVKDGSMNVTQYLAGVAKDLGGDIKIVEYVRFEKGEGLEKREDNFGDEIAELLK